MAAPVWETLSGDLGRIQEAEFYNFQLLARDPDAPDDLSATPGVVFNLQAGVIPPGLRLTRQGVCEGRPSCFVYVAGVPTDVGKDVTSRFVVRATSQDTGEVDDRTFELTIVGEDDPIFVTASGLLGTYRDGDYVDISIVASDADPDDTLVYSFLSGELPSGVTISSTGQITGYIDPVSALLGSPGFDTDSVGFDVNSFDFRTIAENKNYEFQIQVTDGKSIVASTYQLYVYAGNFFTADSDVMTADQTGYPLTADQRILRNPALLTEAGLIDTVTHDNYYAFEFTGKDFDGDPIEFVLDSGALPTGLTLNSATGWIYGTLPGQSATEITYTFGISVRKQDVPSYKSATKTFTIDTVGNIRSTITWLTDTDLGIIRVGDISTFRLEATNTLNKILSYDIDSGSISRLPQGLKLQKDGLIVGRPAFKTFMIDSGTTTFDQTHPVLNETTFERVFDFTVRIVDPDGDISTTKSFQITINPGFYKPYENIWAKAFPKVEHREIWESLIDSPDDFPPEKIYRGSDYWFGKQRDIRMILTAGLNPLQAENYIASMAKNHYNKQVTLGEIRKARAVSNGIVVYEVIYADIKDRGENNLSVSTSSSIDFLANHGASWDNPITVDQGLTADNNIIEIDIGGHHVFYPNSFDNMNQNLFDDIGQLELEALPLWMKSKQEDGSILGFTPAVVIAYVTPGSADEIVFNINRRTDIDLKMIEFKIDRYIWDNDMSVNWDKTLGTPAFIPSAETTFDLDATPLLDSQTVFDGDSTKFLQNSFIYKESRDDSDQFLKFPQQNIEQ